MVKNGSPENTLPVTMTTVATSAFPAVTMTPDELNIITIIAPVVAVLVVCLLVVCVIATIIILYQNRKKDSPGNKHEATEVLYDLPTMTYANDHTHNGNKNALPIYSTIDEEGAPDDYTEMNDTVNNTIHVDENPAYASSTTKDTPNKDKTIHVADNPAYASNTTKGPNKDKTDNNPAYCTIAGGSNTPR